MAYTSLRDLVLLAIELQSTSIGLTMNETMERIAERKGKCSRKTAERMLRGLYELGLQPTPSQLESDHHSVKRWRIEGGVPVLLGSNGGGLDGNKRITYWNCKIF